MKRILFGFALIGSAAFAESPAAPAAALNAPATPAVQAAAPDQASDASIKELLALTDAAKILDSMRAQIGGMMQNAMTQAAGGRQLNPTQLEAMKKFQAKCQAIVMSELSWDKMEPLYTRVYKTTFTQQEMDGIIAFYKTPAGQSLIKKMPVLMQRVMAEIPSMTNPMMQKLQGYSQELVKDLQAAEETKVPETSTSLLPAAPATPAATPAK